ncbi:MAG: hypothetical protein KJT03_18030, partial [Verrucomicrobiae bacterium]|nr:hypothetical protein [Verrucomicrobiae bacterium]
MTIPERFKASMVMDFERWHDGIGYDLELLKSASPEELAEIEAILLAQPVDDWRDVEALAALNTPETRAYLIKSLETGDFRIANAISNYAPNLVNDGKRSSSLVEAIENV